MDTATMISDLEANGKVELPIAMIGDLMDIDVRVKYGDAVIGWRGDPSMGVFFNQVTHEFEIWGIDRAGNDYKAASNPTLDQQLIVKLRDGDPRLGDVMQRVLDTNAKRRADAEAVDRDARGELGEKLQWAIRRDMAAHNGGRGAVHSIPRKVGG